MSDNERRRGRRGVRACGRKQRERDLCMIIRSLGKTLTKNSLPTSWSPDSTPSCLFFSSPSTHPSACSPHNSLCLVFSFSLCQRHHCLITESLLSSSKTEARWERTIYREWERANAGERFWQATIMWRLCCVFHLLLQVYCVCTSNTSISAGAFKCPVFKWDK